MSLVFVIVVISHVALYFFLFHHSFIP